MQFNCYFNGNIKNQEATHEEKVNIRIYSSALGSRLHSLMKKHVSFPVGRVEYLTLRPCSFAEFINAKEGNQWAEMLRNISVPEFMHHEMMAAFNTYALVGGMPEVVAKWVETHNFEKVEKST